ncbi:MAG: methionine--tRNA ligase [Bacteriovoracaceae bacterium]|nr:methionine--tRNA ligase [Bacteriovoracaceae bacterium]
MKKYLVTSALPYSNGPLHFGHIAGVYLPADIYVRHKRLCGDTVAHISGADQHGVAIMQNAQKLQVPYQSYVQDWSKKHQELFKSFQIEFSFFGETATEYHKVESQKWFTKLVEKGAIGPKVEDQLQCQDCKNFLPDRYVEGTCYVCGYKEARGDECPECGTWIDPLKLTNRVCKFCNSQNIEVKGSTQWYLLLSKFSDVFQKWFKGKKAWRKTVDPFVESLAKEGLVDRAITRDLDWGIDVPLAEAAGKKMYVWFDAPIGYVSNTKEWLRTTGSKEDYLKDWWNNSNVEIVNFIGKDNIIFHAITFPMMSIVSEFTRPVDLLAAQQYVNLAGKQFSKSKGHYVDIDEALEKCGVDALRYYLIWLIPEEADTSFTWKGCEGKINGELANNIGNFMSRALKFMNKQWVDGIESKDFDDFFKSPFYLELEISLKEIKSALDQFEFRRSLEMIMKLGTVANLSFSEAAPWALIKTDEAATKKVIASAALSGYALGVLLAPFLPGLSGKILELYPSQLSDEKVVSSFYREGFTSLAEIVSKMKILKLIKDPEILVPKLDSKMVNELEAKLLATVVENKKNAEKKK